MQFSQRLVGRAVHHRTFHRRNVSVTSTSRMYGGPSQAIYMLFDHHRVTYIQPVLCDRRTAVNRANYRLQRVRTNDINTSLTIE